MSLQEKLKEANLNDEDSITLVYETGDDVVHAWDGYEEEVLQSSGLSDTVAALVTNTGFKNDVIKDLRDGDYLEGYPRDGSGFNSYVSEVITENFWDMEFIERSTERYDYKRGYCTLEANVGTTVGSVLSAPQDLFGGWKATVNTKLGSLTIE
jgi:hypothetical protein